MADLEAAKAQQRRLMGGVDPVGCIEAAKLVTRLRMMLTDDDAMMRHLGQVVARDR